MPLEYYSKNLIRLGDGKLAAEYVACITDKLINEDWDAEPSILRKHITALEKNDQEFTGNAAKVLGWWTCETHFTLHFNQFALPDLNSELLTSKPDNLGHPIVLDSDSLGGRKLWLVKAHIRPAPLRIP